MNPSAGPVVAIVVAAGSGSRLGAGIPKALVEIAGQSLVYRSVQAMLDGGATRVVVVIPPDYRAQFTTALAGLDAVIEVIDGGSRRQDSVASGLAALADMSEDSVLLIHDAARPLVPREVVRRVVEAVRTGADAVVPVVPVADSIRVVDGEGSQVVERSGLRAVQTPQGFSMRVARLAHGYVAQGGFEVSDDASAAQLLGYPVVLVAGDRAAHKITEPLDLIVAEAILQETACG